MKIEYLEKTVRLCAPFSLQHSPFSWITTDSEPQVTLYIKSYQSYRPIRERKVIYVPPERWYPYSVYGLRYILAGDYDRGFLVHAGAVSKGDGAILFVGRSGNGKTWAVKRALQKGFSYLGEDIVDLRDGKVFMHIPFTIEVQNYMRNDALKRICFVNYSPGAHPVVLKLSADKGFGRLLEQIFNLDRVFDRINQLRRMLDGVEILFAMYHDFSEVEERCLY